MQNFNIHTHTARCRHAYGEDEQFVRAAVDAGYTMIGFSDHCPFDGFVNEHDRMDPIQKEDYLASIRKLKEKYKGQIDIHCGFEFEYFPEKLEEIKKLKEEADYLLLGQHYQTAIGFDYGCYCTDEDVLLYASQVTEAIRNGLADAVAHPDYFMMGRRSWSDACSQAAHQIASCAAQHHIPLELNLNGIRYGKKQYAEGKRYCYPFREFWEIASQYPIQVIYGVDAHEPLTLRETDRYALIDSIIEGIPLNHLTKLPW